jgi:hypothetical protein
MIIGQYSRDFVKEIFPSRAGTRRLVGDPKVAFLVRHAEPFLPLDGGESIMLGTDFVQRA